MYLGRNPYKRCLLIRPCYGSARAFHLFNEAILRWKLRIFVKIRNLTLDRHILRLLNSGQGGSCRTIFLATGSINMTINRRSSCSRRDYSTDSPLSALEGDAPTSVADPGTIRGNRQHRDRKRGRFLLRRRWR